MINPHFHRTLSPRLQLSRTPLFSALPDDQTLSDLQQRFTPTEFNQYMHTQRTQFDDFESVPHLLEQGLQAINNGDSSTGTQKIFTALEATENYAGSASRMQLAQDVFKKLPPV